MPALQNQILQSFRTFRELKRASLTIPGDLLSISNIPPLPYLLLELHIRRIGSLDVRLRFNNDTTANYQGKQITDAGAAANQINETSSRVTTFTVALHALFSIVMHNHVTIEKTMRGKGATSGALGAGSATQILEYSGKWANVTNRIDRIDLINTDTGDFDVETQMILSGHG